MNVAPYVFCATLPPTKPNTPTSNYTSAIKGMRICGTVIAGKLPSAPAVWKKQQKSNHS